MVDKRWQQPAAGSDVGHAFAQVYDEIDALIARVAKMEKRLYAPPLVVDETAYYPVADVLEGQTVRTMVASNAPTGWEIVDENMNGLPTTGYWTIDADGAIALTNIGVASVKKFANVEVGVRAHNEFGSGDGKFDVHFT